MKPRIHYFQVKGRRSVSHGYEKGDGCTLLMKYADVGLHVVTTVHVSIVIIISDKDLRT